MDAEGEGQRFDYLDGREARNEHARRILHQTRLRHHLRENNNPFTISVTEFVRMYRMPQHLLMELCNTLRPYIPIKRGTKYIPVELKVLSGVSFFASGSYQRITGRSADINLSQSSISNSISEVVAALNHPDVLLRYIRFPMTHPEREAIIARNETLGMPRVLGFVDGTLVKIVPPNGPDKQVYRCRKGWTAVNVQIVCNSDLYIMNVNSQFPGSSNDPFIYRMSGVRNVAMQAFNESRCWLLGDSAYPFEPWCMPPLPGAERNTPEYSYNRLHCHCRNCVERCIGVLKGRWRCLLCARTLHYQPTKAGHIINGCVVLHNFLIERRAPHCAPVFENMDDEAEPELQEDMEVLHQAQEVQQYLIHHAHLRRQRMHEGD